MLKRLICFASIIALILCCISKPTANAEYTYGWARVEKDNVNLYATPTSSKIIVTLEKSYYLEILDETNNMLFVSVMENKDGFTKICGYVYTNEVKLIDEQPLSPLYPTVKLIVTADSAPLKLSPVPSAETVVIATNTQSLFYYGKIYNYNKTWYYVSYAGKFGYVESTTVNAPNIVLHPTPLTVDKPVVAPVTDTDEEEIVEKQTSTTPTAEILLLIFVVLLGLGMSLALFLPGNVKNSNVFDADI